ncbi:MAG TPA: hypothetical protein VM243_21600 [Phycisphaerae bacterium]|nr:hypothetical protein [Phycisphaerae bacterium]
MTSLEPPERPRQPDVVPEQWAPTRNDTPEPAWTVHGLPALPGMVPLWFSPRRVGASLAASGWRAAVGAHVLGMVLGLGLILLAELLPMLNPVPRQTRFGIEFGYDIQPAEMTWSEYARAPLAGLVVIAHGASSGPAGFVVLLLTVAGIEAGVIVLAVLLMPFAAGGESTGRLFGRCVRLTWWSTTLLIPLGMGWLTGPLWREWLDLPDDWHPVDYAGLTLFGLWWLAVLVRSGYRYAGRAEGPAWRARAPLCEGCGYEIVGLHRSSNCPECGRAVVESLPEGRHVPALAAARSAGGLVRAAWATVREAVADKRFFQRLSVHRGHGQARTLFMGVCLINAGVVFGGVFALAALVTRSKALPQYGPVSGNWVCDAVVASGVFLCGQILLAGGVGAMIAAFQRRAVQPSAVGTFYALVSLLPATVGTLTLTLVFVVIAIAFDPTVTAWLSVGNLIVAVVLSVSIVACAFALLALLHNIGRAIVHTRYANA